MRPLWFTQLDENRNPNLGYTALGESLYGQLLGNLGQIEDLNGRVLSNNERENFGVQHFGSTNPIMSSKCKFQDGHPTNH